MCHLRVINPTFNIPEKFLTIDKKMVTIVNVQIRGKLLH